MLEKVLFFSCFSNECEEHVLFWFFASLTLVVFVLIASEVIETNGVSPECLGKNETPTLATGSLSNSLKEHGVNVCFRNGQGLSKASNVEFISLPPMHINDQVEPVDMQNMQTHGGGIDSKSFFEPTGCREPLGINKKTDSVPCSQIGICAQRIFFCPHWSVEAVEKGLEVSMYQYHSHTYANKHVPTI